MYYMCGYVHKCELRKCMYFILFTRDSSSSTRSKSTFIMSPSSVGKKRANLAIKPDTSLFTAAEPLALSNKPKKASVCYKNIIRT